MRLPAAILAAAATAALAIGVTAVPAHADSTISATYPVTGTTTIKKLNATVALGPGSLGVVLDTTTSTLTATLSLPQATVSTSILGIPVTATTNFIQDGTATGTADLSTNTVSTTAMETLQITSLKIGSINIPVGNNCETAKPASITVNSQSGFNVLFGGNLAGTYTIPDFAHCGLATLLLNLTIPGAGNTITLTLGGATLN